MTGCGCSGEPTIADIRHHRAVKAANEGMRRLKALKQAELSYKAAKSTTGEYGVLVRRRTAKAVRDAQKAVSEGLEKWEEAERNMLPLEADHG